MILFVFEGQVSEPIVFDSLAKLYLTSEEVCTVCCKYDLPTLYSKLKKHDYDIFRVLPFKDNGIDIPEDTRLDTLFSQIFLFFDYDFQNRMGVKKLNDIIYEMLEYFSDETDNGKLYINYPMVESLKYTKEMPDPNYNSYVTSRQTCVDHLFKAETETYAYPAAKAYRFIDLGRTPEDEVLRNWEELKLQNVSKANYIVSGQCGLPAVKENIIQLRVFEAQKDQYVLKNDEVAILNSFPLFLYEFFK